MREIKLENNHKKKDKVCERERVIMREKNLNLKDVVMF